MPNERTAESLTPVDPMKECPRMFAATRIGEGINEGCKLERELAEARAEKAQKDLCIDNLRAQLAQIEPYADHLAGLLSHARRELRVIAGHRDLRVMAPLLDMIDEALSRHEGRVEK